MSFGDRRAPLRRTGFKRKAPTNTDRKPRPRVKPRADRRVGEEKLYAHLRSILLPKDEYVACEAGPKLFAVGTWTCSGRATELHHRRKRSASGALANPANVVRCCHECNMFIEDYPQHARAAGLVVREGDPGWYDLSARAWRKML